MNKKRKVSFALMIANFDIFENYDTFNKVVKKFFSKKLSKRFGWVLEIKEANKIEEEELMINLKKEKKESIKVYIKKINSEIKIKDIGIFPYIVYSDPTTKINIDIFNRLTFNVARAFYPYTYLRTIPPFMLYNIAKYIAEKYADSVVSRVVLSRFIEVDKINRKGKINRKIDIRNRKIKIEESVVRYPKEKYLMDFLREYNEELKGRSWIKGISIREMKEDFTINIKKEGIITVIDDRPFERFYEIFKEPILYLLKDASKLKIASKNIEKKEDIVGIKISLLGEDITFATLVEEIIKKMSNISYFITANFGDVIGSLELIDKESNSVFSIVKLRKKEILIAVQSYATIPSLSKMVDEFRNRFNGEDIKIVEKVF